MNRPLLIFLFALISSIAFSQSRTITGKVTSSEDGQGIPGANILVVGGTNGTTSDIDGNYSITLDDGETSLSFSFIGYKSQTAEVGDRSVINITLESDVTELDDIVVVGYGVQKKRDVTGAVASVKGDEIAKIPASNPVQGLMGKVAGVQVTNTSGAPGSSPFVRIRGVGTFNNSSPIYVVDGVILDDISYLNSGDIQSMEVLKDASSTAIYGSRGANGVIMVTTKIGSRGKESSVINFSADYSIQKLQKQIPVLSGTQFANVVNDITPGTYNNVDAVPNTNWQDQIFRMAPIQNYQFSASGSSAKMQYYVGIGYFKQDGVIPKSSYERLTIKLNNVYHLSKSIRLGNNITLSPFQQQNTSGNAVLGAYRAQPVVAPFQADGSYSPVRGVGNVLADIDYTNSYSKSLRTVGNVYAEADFLKGFTFKTSVGVDMQYTKNRSFTPVFFVSPQQQSSYSTLNKDWNDRVSLLWENTLNYNKELGKHRINALVGYTMQNISSENLSLQGRNILRDSKDFWYIDLNNIYPKQVSNSVDADNNYSMMSVLGRINYTYDDRFLLTATFRRDGSSKFIKANRFASFPSVAIGWNIINENFMRDITAITNLKVRASYGVIGNEKINYLKQYSVVDNGASAVFGKAEAIVPGLTYAVSGNPNLKWESTYQTDVGLEMAFFNNQLTAEVDYYNRDTKDILIDLPIPGYLGNGDGATITYNAGEVLNRGIEMNINWKGRINDDFGYSLGALGSTVHNEVLNVYGTGGNDDYLLGRDGGAIITKTVVGAPIGSFYGYQTDGVFQTAAELAAYPHRSDADVGDLRFIDRDGNGKIDDGDRINMGSPIPKLLYGFNVGASYKHFEMSVDFNGQSGNKIYNGKEVTRPDLYNFEEHVINRWQGEGTSNTEPRATSGGYNWLPSTRFIQNGSYLRLRSITLAYSVPSEIAQKVKMKTARVYLRGTNIFTSSKFTGYTPEVGNGSPLLNGIDSGTYPIPAVYSAGVNITF